MGNYATSSFSCSAFYNDRQRFAATRRQGLLPLNFLRRNALQIYEKLSYEAQNPCLRVGAVSGSLLLSVHCVIQFSYPASKLSSRRQ